MWNLSLHCPGFSSCGMRALEHEGSAVVALGLSCLTVWRILVPQPGIKPESPALEVRFLTTGPPGKPPKKLFLKRCWGPKKTRQVWSLPHRAHRLDSQNFRDANSPMWRDFLKTNCFFPQTEAGPTFSLGVNDPAACMWGLQTPSGWWGRASPGLHLNPLGNHKEYWC